MTDDDQMKFDVTRRICNFGAKHFGLNATEIASDQKKLEISTDLFWQHYFESKSEL